MAKAKAEYEVIVTRIFSANIEVADNDSADDAAQAKADKMAEKLEYSSPDEWECDTEIEVNRI